MFTESLWQEWVSEENKNYSIVKGAKKYLKKGYLHFDPRFWFPDRFKEIKEIVSNPNALAKRSFHPFVKIIIETPRFKYNEDEESYSLEIKKRPIIFASHKDALVLGFYSYCLTKQYEEYIKRNKFDECVLAYRTDLQKSNIQFAKEVFDYIKNREECVAIALDIKGYFDNIDHLILKEKWCKIIDGNLPDDQYKIYKTLTSFNYVNKAKYIKHFTPKGKKKLHPITLLDYIDIKQPDYKKFQKIRAAHLIAVNNKLNKRTSRYAGIPQGSPISALLSNMYLIDYDHALQQRALKENFLYRRYCDDILIICDKKQAYEIEHLAISLIQESHLLEIQPKKVERITFRKNSKGLIRGFNEKKIEKTGDIIDSDNESKYYKPLQYLGFEYNGKDILIRSSSLSRYFRRMKQSIRKTVAMAYSKTGKNDAIFKQKLYHKYTHLGKRNFVTYAYNAASEIYRNNRGNIKEGLNSPAIKKQLARHFNIIKKELLNKNLSRYYYKVNIKKKGTKYKRV